MTKLLCLLLCFLLSSLVHADYPWAQTNQPYPDAPQYPPPSSSVQLVVYANTQSTCSPGLHSMCPSKTPPLIADKKCHPFWSAPFLYMPESNVTTGLAYMFDDNYNLNIYGISSNPSSTVTNTACSGIPVISFNNPQWNLASQCSLQNLTTFYQIAWENGITIANGSMILDFTGFGYGVCPLGYFWPTQPGCDPTVNSPLSNNAIIRGTSNLNLTACPSGSIPQPQNYAMTVTLGLYNPCLTGCDASALRTCLNALQICYNDVQGTKNTKDLCSCVNGGLPLCALISTQCTDSYALKAMNTKFIEATHYCSVDGTPISLFQTAITCTDCSPATAFAVIFALLFGGLFFWIVYQRYKTRSAAPLRNLRQEAINNARL